MSQLCALAGVTRQAFYKCDDGLLFRKLAIEQFVVQFVREVRGKDPRIGADKLIHHSDRGTQYACSEYIKQLRLIDITPSMTESGNPKDNATAERINNTVKDELLHGRTFTSLEQVTAAVESAILFYNSERPHSSLDWHTPDQAHQMSGEMKRHWHSWREDAIRREQKVAS
ncbi:MAG: integrase core domain-containing protein [Bacteroidales bacterium]|nr:integrase core domain-containing protein [Bacteroidales bacterium]